MFSTETALLLVSHKPVQHAASDTMARSRVGVMFLGCESVVSSFSADDISADKVSANDICGVAVCGPY